MFRSYCAVLNSLPTDATTKLTINNRRLNGADFQRSVLMREKGDRLDVYRKEYNAVLTGKSAASNNLVQDKYITVSVSRKNVEEARATISRTASPWTVCAFGRTTSRWAARWAASCSSGSTPATSRTA